MKSATKIGRLLRLILAGALIFFVSFVINVAPVNASLIRDTKVVSAEKGKSFIFTQSEKFLNIEGATATVTLPNDHAAGILVRFTGASSCVGDGSTYCLIRILVDGKPIEPYGAKNGVEFDRARRLNLYENEYHLASHTTESFTGRLPAGTYQVQVQKCSTLSGGEYPSKANFWLADWFLTVQVLELPL